MKVKCITGLALVTIAGYAFGCSWENSDTLGNREIRSGLEFDEEPVMAVEVDGVGAKPNSVDSKKLYVSSAASPNYPLVEKIDLPPLLIVDFDDFHAEWEEQHTKPIMVNKVERRGTEPISRKNSLEIPVVTEPLPMLDSFDDDLDFHMQWLVEDQKRRIFYFIDEAWWIAYNVKVLDLKQWAVENPNVEVSLVCMDRMPLRHLVNAVKAFDGRSEITLQDQRGLEFKIELPNAIGCGALPVVEPMVLSLLEKGVRVNNRKIMPVHKFAKQLGVYKFLLTKAGEQGVIDIRLHEINDQVVFKQFIVVLTYAEGLRCRLTHVEGIHSGGRRTGIELLPASPHTDKTRWKDHGY